MSARSGVIPVAVPEKVGMEVGIAVGERLHALGLIGMAERWAMQEKGKDRRAAGPRLLELLDAEGSDRATRAFTRRQRVAGLEDRSADVRDLAHVASRGLDGSVVRALARSAWVTAGSHLAITGGTGTGKSWLACALANAALAQGRSVQSWAVVDLVTEWDALGDRLPLLRRRLDRLDLLILEDWGKEPLLPKDILALRRVLMDRMARDRPRSILIVSTLPPASWRAWLGGGLVADELVDRLLHASQVLELQGGSLRGQLPPRKAVKQ